MAISIEDAIRAAGVGPIDAATAQRFAGYLGNSSLESMTRLYLSEQLNEYIEVANNAIVAMIDLGGENSPLVLMLVRPKEKIKHSAIVSEHIEADFLAGDIAERNLQDDRFLWSPGPEEFAFGPTDMCASMGGPCLGRNPRTRRMRS